MDITFLGHASFRLKGKQASLICDPYDQSTGLKFPKAEADIVTISHDHADHNAANLVAGEPFLINGPGEYEKNGVKIIGVASFHDDNNGRERGQNTLYNIRMDGINICHLGDLGQNDLTSSQLDLLGNVDILLIPTGGIYTIDASTASKIVAIVEAKIVIPMHYLDKEGKIKLDEVSVFLKEMGVEETNPEAKLTVSKEKLPDEMQVVLLEKKA